MPKARKSTLSSVHIPVLRHQVLGVNVLRGYARLCDLARMSRADVYDQKTNPSGTQRDLSQAHARDAYLYVKTEQFAFWPEIFLCARDSDVFTWNPLNKKRGFGLLSVDMQSIKAKRGICISRVDGNHRLHFAGGDFEGYDAIEKPVSFCFAYNLSREQEIKLFRDINNNQRRMNTSHLDNIQVRLTETSELRRKEPHLYIAKKLSDDKSSPIYGMVFEGGKKAAGTHIPLRTLRTGINYMMSRPTRLTALSDPDAQYKVTKNYLEAVKRWVPAAWKQPKDYVVLRGAGLWGIFFIGAEVIDRTLRDGNFSSEAMLKVLKSGKNWDWSNRGEFQGLSGRGGAVKMRDTVTAEFQDEKGVSVKELFKKIMED
jgi:DGQHR domain-containing protein